MNLVEKSFFNKRTAKILIILLPRLIILLFLLLQNSFWQDGFFLKDHIPLLILITADILISIFYSLLIFKKRVTIWLVIEKKIKVPIRTLADTLFFLYSVIVCYFMVFAVSRPGLFGAGDNPYENILFVAIIQLASLGFIFCNLSLRLIPKVFVKYPYIPMGLSVFIFGLCFLLRDAIQSALSIATNNISTHFTALCLIFYSIAVFYFFYTGCLMCYKRYLKSYAPVRIIIKVLPALGLALIILLLAISEDGYSFFNIMSFLAPGLFRLIIEYSYLWICFFIAFAGLIMAAASRNKLIQKTVFVLMCICLPINLYAALVLLPVFSIVPFFALFYPATLLYFFPYVVLFFHVLALFHTKQVFTSKLKTPVLQFSFVFRVMLMLLILPFFVVLNAFLDKAVLQQAYYSMHNSGGVIRLDRSRLQSVLDEFNNKRRRSYTPFITPLRRAVILENKELNSGEVQKLSMFYLATANSSYVSDTQRIWPQEVLIQDICEISYSAHGSSMQSKVLIEIENPHQSMDEFYRRFEIPAGVFITDFSLWIDGVEKKGFLALKEPALTVYNRISRSLKDPALLRYESDGSCSLRVFPVQAGEKRRVAITFSYREPFVFALGSKLIRIDHSLAAPASVIGKSPRPGIPLTIRNHMYRRQTESVLHFIIDYSGNTDITLGQAANTIQILLKKINWQGRLRYTVANYNWKTYDALPEIIRDHSVQRQGSFVYSRVLSGLLYEYKNTAMTPRFIILSDTNGQWMIHASLLAYKINYPGLQQAYRLDSSGDLYVFPVFAIHNEKKYELKADAYSATPIAQENKLLAQSDNLFPLVSVCSENTIAEIMQQNSHLDTLETNALLFLLWSNGEIMHDTDSVLHEQLSRYAQRQGLLMPFLSYLVLENVDQERLLKELEQNSGQGTLLHAADITPVNMTEPPVLPTIIAGLFLIGFIILIRYKRI